MAKKIYILTVISLSHFVVDAACIMLVMKLSANANTILPAFLILLYDTLAFATQPVLGYITDKLNKPEKIAGAGCVITLAGILLLPFPYLAVFVSGIGNALFHVGGGVTSLRLDPGKAWAPGIFIAPGTMGVFVGNLLSKQAVAPWILTAFLCVTALLIWTMRIPALSLHNKPNFELSNNKLFSAALLFILVTVAVRSYTGLAISYSWKTDIGQALFFSVCVLSGKALGGILSDKFGYLKVPLAGLILSVPCLTLGFSNPVAGSLGMLLFNLTMPVTLLLAANLFPGYEGLGFGMTVLALSIGTIPAFAGLKLVSGPVTAIVVIASAVTFLFGYAFYNKLSHKIV